MSTVTMLSPSEGVEGIKKRVVDWVKQAGSNPCPPVVVGVGIGGTFEQTALMAKKALLRPLGQKNPDSQLAALEQEILTRVNNLGIGPQGLGGRITALAVHVEMIPCHIASFPMAVNINCHAHRHKEAVI
jgi:fumarate hydratase subunit alpha